MKKWIPAVLLGSAAAALLLWLSARSSLYTALSASGLYHRSQADYDTVAEWMIEQPDYTLYSANNRENWPKEISAALDHLLGDWRVKSRYPTVDRSDLNGRPAVLFSICVGPERDTGDGSTGYDEQYLAYIPGESEPFFENPNTEKVERLADCWYLYWVFRF